MDTQDGMISKTDSSECARDKVTRQKIEMYNPALIFGDNTRDSAMISRDLNQKGKGSP